MDKNRYIHQLIHSEHNTLPKLLEDLFALFQEFEVNKLESISSAMIDVAFLEEIKNLPEYVTVAFGKTLRDIKCTVNDNDIRKHDIYLSYDGYKKLRIVSIDLPCGIFTEQIYSTIEDITRAVLKHSSSLQNYFYELENIDRQCMVMEPVKPLFKDDYRNIRIDDKTWLHLEVTLDGLATNVHLIGQSEMWQDRLQKGLLTWDQDKNIVENIVSIFDLNNEPLSSKTMTKETEGIECSEDAADILCAICFCVELPDNPGLPQPLCQNLNCDVHYHKHCLFQWLVACEGGRPPAFGVINGSCPTCLQPISCSDKD